MAIEVFSDVQAALSELFDDMVQNQMNRKGVLLNLMLKKQGEGKNCAWDVRFTGATAGTFAEGADVVGGDLAQDDKQPAVLAWGLYRSSFGVSGLLKAVTAASRTSPSALRNIVGDDLKGSAGQLGTDINIDLYAGTGAGLITGINDMTAATGTYAGLAKATFAEWAGNTDDNGGVARALTKDLIDTMESTIYDRCGEAPTILVGDSATVRKYEGLFSALSRINQTAGELSALGPAPGGGAIYNARTGYSGLDYKGIPVYRDKDITLGGGVRGELYLLNLEHLELQSVPAVMDNDTGAVTSMQELMDDSGQGHGISAHYQRLAKLGDSDRFSLVIYPQMKAKAVNCHGRISDIDLT